ncbi:hypothetical protein BIV57_17965 [Mangrovactinospora gilvigrisea]|uniref:Uncharacterized protein n=1 Tax=Mangrovactinospora gilvigrisea TaxID=1428644 RepID=A0A1J7C3J0_9ACTN|nr:hypothetical protein [Mangrovactinospora gilvigrisea]OIV36124.1 hypothetical protein BIV57_17965 [Mangrovactinospora gilvigrisea]
MSIASRLFDMAGLHGSAVRSEAAAFHREILAELNKGAAHVSRTSPNCGETALFIKGKRANDVVTSDGRHTAANWYTTYWYQGVGEQATPRPRGSGSTPAERYYNGRGGETYWLQKEVQRVSGLPVDPRGPAFGLRVTPQEAEQGRARLAARGYVLLQTEIGAYNVYPPGTDPGSVDPDNLSKPGATKAVGVFNNVD